MKRFLLVLCAVLFAALCVFFLGVAGNGRFTPETAFSSIPETGLPAASVPASEGAPRLLIRYRGEALPETEGTVLLPVLPEAGLTVTTERGAALTKAKNAKGEWVVSAEKGGAVRSLTLTETGIGVCSLSLTSPETRDPADPVGEGDEAAVLVLLYTDGSGALAVDTAPVTVSIRGQSSRSFEKKSYTVKVSTSRSRGERPLMGFPEDTAFALNSMYEDDSKIRDALSLGLWRRMILPEDAVGVPLYRYTELFIDGEYRGLYGFQQITTPRLARLSAGDGMVKIASPMTSASKALSHMEVIRSVSGMDIARVFTDALTGLASGDEAALALFDPDNLMRVFTYVQFTAAVDNLYQNMMGVWRADRGLFTIVLFDTDLTFGLTHLGFGKPVAEWAKEIDMAEVDATMFRPVPGILLYGGRFREPLSKTYAALRETALREETLLADARALFGLVTESGAREREHARWPNGAYTDSLKEIEDFLTGRFAFTDAYFEAFGGPS